ncbi:MAG: helix-turn-helix transcriptional regulator [Gammaproteobacteria bacterium]|nr:helix-turn-helix transcriptional regulator [Gammaproteobacteria bacterium]
MSQTADVLNALKKVLRARGLTYQDLAGALKLSEASVKRLFSEQTFSLQRLEDACRFLDMNLYDLTRMTRLGEDEDTTRLDLDQEKALAGNTTMLTYFYLLLTGWKPARIARKLELDGPHNTQVLARLDRLRLIELHPKNRVRLMTNRRIAWRADGPIRKLYEQEVKQDFVRSKFTGRDDALTFETAELSEAAISVLTRRLARLEREFDDLADLDMNLPPEQKRNVGLMLAMRPWTYWQILGQQFQNEIPAERLIRPNHR